MLGSLCTGIQYVIFLRWLLWSLRNTKLNYIIDETGGRKLRFYLKHRTSLLCYVILELLHNLLKYLVGELTQLASC